MQLYNRIRLISTLPLLLLFFGASYFIYSSYTNLEKGKHLEETFTKNHELHRLISGITKERGLSSIAIAKKQRDYLLLAKEINKNDMLINNIKESLSQQELATLSAKISDIRTALQEGKTNFREVFHDGYNDTLLKNLEAKLTNYDVHLNADIEALKNALLQLRADIHSNALQRDYLSYFIAGKNL